MIASLEKIITPVRRRLDRTPPTVLRRALLASLAAVVILNLSLYMTCGWRGCPDPALLNVYMPGGASVLLDRNGREFANVAPFERRLVKLKALPDYAAAAFVAVEDKRFYQHRGVDWRRVMGALSHNLFSRGRDQGSSTITMQLSRNIFSTKLRADDRSLRRKLFEARVARKIERRFSKPEILELYLNHIYFGEGAYGIESAAREYFNKRAADLDVDEAALLAALPKAPSTYNPREQPSRARERRNLVLKLMAAQGLLSDAAVEAAQRRGLGVRENTAVRQKAGIAPYFTQQVRKQLEQRLGEDLYRKRYRIVTTLDVDAQRAAEAALNRRIENVDGSGELQGAVVVMESLTGDIIAWVGGVDYARSAYDRAANAHRQAGSAFKPFVYAEALAEGIPPSQLILDAPYTFTSNGQEWSPRNFDNRFVGPISMRDALVQSRNVPSVRLARAIGPGNAAKMARDAGIRSEIKNTPMIALGITEVTPLELVRAYGSFAGLGRRAEPRFVQRVENDKGAVVFKTEVEREKAIEPGVAFMMTDMLAQSVNSGTGSGVRKAGFNGPAAGKTGTTNDAADAWFIGYTPDLVAGVWIGYDQRRALPSHASGGTMAAPVWGALMRDIYQTRPMPRAWIAPGEIKTRLVDPESGLVLAPGCTPRVGSGREEVFLEDQEVREVCPAGTPKRGLFGSIGAWLTRLFERQPPNEKEPADHDLGTVRVVNLDGESKEEIERDDEDDDDRAEQGEHRRGKHKGHGRKHKHHRD